jgi:hypothetical protein
MNQKAVDERIATVISRQASASSTEQYLVTIEQGTERQKPRAGAGQIESSIPFSTWKEVAPEPKVIKPADVIDANPKPIADSDVVKLGRVTIAPSTISGWEARFTRGWTAFDVTLDGKPVKGDQALEAIYNSLREMRSTPKGKVK